MLQYYIHFFVYVAGNEAALLMRLHLLQAIVLYHQNKRQEARDLLLRANNELLTLKVDERSLLSLIELGKCSIVVIPEHFSDSCRLFTGGSKIRFKSY